MKFSQTQPIQVVRLELTDTHALEQLSQKRDEKQYNPSYINDHHFLLPLNVDRFLFSLEAIADLQKTVQMYGIEDAHIKIIKYGLLCPTAHGIKTCLVPLHVATSFRYNRIRITGRYFVSLLHTAVASLPESLWNEPWATDLQEVRQPLSSQERQALLEYYMRAYLEALSSCTDLTIIAIPAKPSAVREKSPTHKAFMNLASPCSGSNECIITTREGSDMYLFTHDNEECSLEDIRRILLDQNLLNILSHFFWSDHISQKQQAISAAEMQSQDFMMFYYRQFYPLLEWLRVTWKNAEGSRRFPEFAVKSQ